MGGQGYWKSSLPSPLIERVLQVIEEGPGEGYRNPTEFVIDAIRRRLAEVENGGTAAPLVASTGEAAAASNGGGRRYAKPSFPQPLFDAISDFIEARPELGYRNPSEFIVEAARVRLGDLSGNRGR